MRRTRLATCLRILRPALVSIAAAVAPIAASAFQLPFDARVRIQFLSIPALETQLVSRVAQVSLGAGGAIQSLSLSLTPASIATTGAEVGPLATTWTPIDGLRGTYGLFPTAAPLLLQTFARSAGGSLGGSVRVLGVVRVCLFSPTGACPGISDVFIPLAHPTPGTGSLFYDAAIGWDGTWAQPGGGGVNLTVRGAPWTTGTADAGGGVTGMGFAVGPASLPGTTARNGGRLNLVTPIFVSSSLSAVPLFPGIATLEIEFTGDPPECANGIDDDGDGLTDWPNDPVCQSYEFAREASQCQDGINNDADGNIDFDGGASWNGGVPLTAPDGQCVNKPYRNREAPDSCGVGGELALVLGVLAALRRGRALAESRG